MADFCSNCGNPIREGQRFCTNCGSPVAIPAAEVTEAAEQIIEKAEETVNETAEAAEQVSEAVENVAEEAEKAAEAVTEAVETAPEAPAVAPETPAAPVAPVAPEPVIKQDVQPDPVVTPVIPVPVYQQQQPVYQQQTYQQPSYQQTSVQQYPLGPSYIQQIPQDPSQQKKKKQKLGVGRRILAFCLCLFLFIFGLGTLVFYCIRKSFTPDNINDVLLSSKGITEMEIGTLVGNAADDESETLSHFVLRQIPDEQKDAYPELTEENLNKLLENKEVRKIVSDSIGDVVGYYTGENDKLEIDSDKIIDALTENADLVEEYTGKKLLKEDYDAIRTQIDDFNENELQEITKDGSKDLGLAMKVLKFVFSDTTLYILIGVTAFITLMVMLTCGRFVDSGLIHVGITSALIGGLVYGGVKFGEDRLADALSGKLGENNIDLLRKLLFGQFDNTGLIVLCVGGAVVLFGIIVKILRALTAK